MVRDQGGRRPGETTTGGDRGWIFWMVAENFRGWEEEKLIEKNETHKIYNNF